MHQGSRVFTPTRAHSRRVSDSADASPAHLNNPLYIFVRPHTHIKCASFPSITPIHVFSLSEDVYVDFLETRYPPVPFLMIPRRERARREIRTAAAVNYSNDLRACALHL